MLGINYDLLDSFIKKNSLYYDSLCDSIKNVAANMTDLGNCYAGQDLEFLFCGLLAQTNSINNLALLSKSYIDTLNDVKISYVNQDLNLKYQVDYLHSKNLKEG